jgi:LPS-assembly protein
MPASSPIRASYMRRRMAQCLSILIAAAAAIGGGWLDAVPALAQTEFKFPKRTPPSARKPAQPRRATDQAPMLLQATEMHYDYTNKRVSAVGNVQIYHQGSTVEADKVVYDENTKRIHAEGNVRLTEPNGRITHAEVMNLSDDFRDGFVDSLRLDSPDQTRMAAARADRSGGTYTVFQSGVYTACEPCKDDPRKPPLWQIKAARMIHDQGEKMIYFENANLEFFGRPFAYFPYFSAPDPSVTRKSGFLMPVFSFGSKTGASIETPYYWALAPDYDMTLSPRVMTKQGVMMTGEYRQRLINGAFSIRASGIYQLDKDVFLRDVGPPTPGFRDFRGAIETAGQFALTDKWVWGWDGIAPTDPTYFQDYGKSTYQRTFDPLRPGGAEGISQVYLSGRGDRSYFDARAIYYYGFSEADVQRQIPIIHPVVDYSYTFGQPVFGGELGYRVNFTSLSRDTASFNPITAAALLTGGCGISADPAIKIPANCLLRGVPGSYSRLSVDTKWKRTFTDPYGQVFTPFVILRADAAMASIEAQPGVSNYLSPGEITTMRVMPTVGLEYRYPLINVQAWGTQTVEPIAQIIVRPNEPSIGKLPNEDSQSLIFDDSNLFKVDKFAGWDRIEGGGRANVGVQYTAQFNRGGFVNAMFGQSYQLFGTNSFAVGDATNTGLGSGLDTDRSDYVARISYQPDQVFTLSTRYRFDRDTFDLRRLEVEGRANFDRWSLSVLYGNYDAQPQLGFLTAREGILSSAWVKLDPYWAALGALRYDLDAGKIDQTRIGVGYIDDCIIIALNYIASYAYSGNPTQDHKVLLQVSLRTLGGASFGQSVGSGPNGL